MARINIYLNKRINRKRLPATRLERSKAASAYYWSEPCFLGCGLGWCKHREPGIIEAEISIRLKGLQPPGRK